jgi:Zn-dependent M32 family carboxypeptidase
LRTFRRKSKSGFILPHVHHIERGLIRVDADEVTYPLHVILRFEDADGRNEELTLTGQR